MFCRIVLSYLKRTHCIPVAQYFRKWMCFDIKSRYFFALFTLQLFSLFIKLLVCRMARAWEKVQPLANWNIGSFRCFFDVSLRQNLSVFSIAECFFTRLPLIEFETLSLNIKYYLTPMLISQPIIIFLRGANLSKSHRLKCLVYFV